MSDYDYDEADGFTVDVSSEEASSEAREFSVIPRGAYPIAVTDVELAESKSQKNYGKPYMRLELTIQDEPGVDPKYVGRKLYTNAMLFSGALYTVIQMMKAVDLEVNAGRLVLPNPEFWIGKRMVAVVKVVNKQIKDASGAYVTEFEDEEGKKPVKSNDVGGFRAYGTFKPMTKATASTSSSTSAAAKNSLLP